MLVRLLDCLRTVATAVGVRAALNAGFGVLGVVGVVGVGLSLRGCGCDETFDGLRNDDRVQTTIIRPYTGRLASDPKQAEPFSSDNSCAGFDGLSAGSVLVWSAGVAPAGEGCDCNWSLSISPESLDGVAVSPWTWPPSSADAGGAGCTGSVTFEIDPHYPLDGVSVYAAQPDGGQVSWVFQRTFWPSAAGGDAGPCPFPRGFCFDTFVTRNKKL